MAPGLPRFSVGRSLSSGGLSTEGLSFSGGVFACVCAFVCGDEVVGEEEVEGAVVGGGVAAPGELVEAEAGCEGVAGSADGSVDLGLSLLLRRRTGGPSSSFRPRG